MSKVTWKWKRKKPGHYVCGDWAIIQETQTSWALKTPTGKTHTQRNKKLCQLLAEAEEAKAEAREARKAEQSKASSSESVKEGIRINADQLLFAIIELTSEIKRLREDLKGWHGCKQD
jgi:septal ring factor EnvC (AmiA/AmiB activator)